MFAKGKIYSNDADNYQNPVYSRTMEISKKQYDDLEAFGREPEKYGFNKNYEGTWNNCVDFTWSGLNHAGLHYKNLGVIERKDYEGSLKPTRNIHDIKEIKEPFSNSPLNREQNNPWPKDRNFLQHLLSENDKPAEPAKAITKDSSIDDMFDALWAATVNKDDAAARAVGKAYGESADGQAWLAMGRELNQQDKLQEQQAALDAQKLIDQQAALDAQAQVQRGPVMKMG
jgi:hypothetical protein